jgi:antitoxin (DNA-binding transcriptional repressor) of toxin-antitoxin stability system
VEEAAAGEPFVIAKSGKPLVTVIPYVPVASPPRVGFLKGRIAVPSDFDRMGDKEISAMFEGMS